MKVQIDALDITVLKGGAADIGAWAKDARLPPPARRARGPRLLRQAQPDLPRRRVRRRCGRRARPAGRRRHAGPHHDPDRQPVGAAADPRPRQDRRRARRGRRLPPDRPGARAAPRADRRRTASGWTTAPPRPHRCSTTSAATAAWSGSRTSAWLTKVAVDAIGRPPVLRPRDRRQRRQRPVADRRRARPAGHRPGRPDDRGREPRHRPEPPAARDPVSLVGRRSGSCLADPLPPGRRAR